MAYFRPSIDAAGIHIPTYDDILTYLMDQYKSIFGSDVYLGVDSKDYQLLSVFAKSLDDFAALAVDAYNARSPLYATGDSLDVLCTIVGIVRSPATNGRAVLTLSGANGTEIPSGSKVVDKDGGLWTISSTVTISSGTASANAVKDEAGAYVLSTGSISSIYTPIIGWTGVDNTTVGKVGSDIETDEELRTRMRQALISKAVFSKESMEGTISQIQGVTDVLLWINSTSSTDAHSVPAHSIAAYVNGGDEDEIAQAIFDTKSPGISTYGSISRTVTDAYGNSETVYFSRISLPVVQITIEATITDNRVDVDSMKASITDRMKAYIDEEIGVGESIVVNRLYQEVYTSAGTSGIEITDLYVTTGGTDERTKLTPAWNAKYVLDSTTPVVYDLTISS